MIYTMAHIAILGVAMRLLVTFQYAVMLGLATGFLISPDHECCLFGVPRLKGFEGCSNIPPVMVRLVSLAHAGCQVTFHTNHS